MKEITVLITGAGTATCQSVIKGLRSQSSFKVRVIAADMNPENAGRFFCDAFYKVPAAPDPKFISFMLDVCAREKVNLLIPIVDYEFEKFAATKKDFNKIGCKVAISSPEVIIATTDKWHTYQFFKQANISTPETFLAQDVVGKELKLPVFIKPRILGRSSLNTHKVMSQARFEDLIKTMPECLVQEYKTGEEFTIDTLCDFNGKCVGAVIRKRVEIKSGVSYKGVTVKDDEMLKMAVKIVEGLPTIGAANVQCFKSGNQISFFEVNPRFSGALALSIAAGFNSPAYLARLALGENLKPEIGNYKVGVSMFRYWDEVFTDNDGNRIPSARMELP